MLWAIYVLLGITRLLNMASIQYDGWCQSQCEPPASNAWQQGPFSSPYQPAGISRNTSGVGVTKPISSVPLISRFFTIIETLVTY